MSSTRNFDSGDVAKKTTGEKERCDKSTCVQQIELTKKCSDIIRSVATFNRQEIGPFKDFLDKFKTDMKNVMREGKFITVTDPSKVVPLKVWWFLHLLQLLCHKNSPNQYLMFLRRYRRDGSL